MKNILKYIFCFFMLVLFIAKADALSIDKSSIDLSAGGSDIVELYADVENASSVEFNLVYSTYDIKAEFIVNSSFSEETPSGIKHVVKFKEVLNGKILLGTINIKVEKDPKDLIGNININGAKEYDSDGNSSNLKSQSVTVKVNKKEDEKKQEVDKNLLSEIQSEIVDIKLKDNIFIYDINIDSSIEELDLKPIAKDENTEISIDSQKISELKDNKITISTKNGDVNQNYTINVRIKKENKKVEIDKSEFKPDNSYKEIWKIVAIISGIVVFIGLIGCFKKKII